MATDDYRIGLAEVSMTLVYDLVVYKAAPPGGLPTTWAA